MNTTPTVNRSAAQGWWRRRAGLPASDMRVSVKLLLKNRTPLKGPWAAPGRIWLALLFAGIPSAAGAATPDAPLFCCIPLLVAGLCAEVVP